MVQEYLQGVHIVDYWSNEDKKTCSATSASVVIPKEVCGREAVGHDRTVSQGDATNVEVSLTVNKRRGP